MRQSLDLDIMRNKEALVKLLKRKKSKEIVKYALKTLMRIRLFIYLTVTTFFTLLASKITSKHKLKKLNVHFFAIKQVVKPN
jgi:hypothetical protein